MTVTCLEGLKELIESWVRMVGTRQGFEELSSVLRTDVTMCDHSSCLQNRNFREAPHPELSFLRSTFFFGEFYFSGFRIWTLP
jgi:hypothetical protein